MKVSVLTPTIRLDGLPLVYKALAQQTLSDFEWLICSKEDPKIKEAVWIRDDFDGFNTINRAYNKLFKSSIADVLVSWQDYTYARPDTLERFYEHYIHNPHAVVSAVGNKYASDKFRVMTWKDPRKRTDNGTFYECYFNDIEANLCMWPKSGVFAVGGADEKLDEMGYGMDAFSINDRMNILGTYTFWLDQSIESFSLEHGRPDGWEEKNLIHGLYQAHRRDYVENPRLAYLG
jgi:hypothetical protein